MANAEETLVPIFSKISSAVAQPAAEEAPMGCNSQEFSKKVAADRAVAKSPPNQNSKTCSVLDDPPPRPAKHLNPSQLPLLAPLQAIQGEEVHRAIYSDSNRPNSLHSYPKPNRNKWRFSSAP